MQLHHPQHRPIRSFVFNWQKQQWKLINKLSDCWYCCLWINLDKLSILSLITCLCFTVSEVYFYWWSLRAFLVQAPWLVAGNNEEVPLIDEEIQVASWEGVWNFDCIFGLRQRTKLLCIDGKDRADHCSTGISIYFFQLYTL